ncbi:TetR/AcrR family transcriptional regulator [Propionicimonas sp.]|uniref:TetR/AcrR family transcriptional regulator n=1 Tax=Propionicimonas sp. TaxID=1955623 RepID=UPI0039E45C60
MTTQAPRPRGRRPGRTDTRAAIQAAALTLFSEMGYEKVSLRAIARAADVDPALIHHYFENKADLFSRSVLDQPMDADAVVRAILDGPVESIGERTVAAFLNIWDQPGASERFTAMLRAAVTDPNARRPLSEFLVREVLGKVAEQLGHPDARLRAQIGMSQVLGFALARNILELPALVKARNPVLITALGRAMQACLVGA